MLPIAAVEIVKSPGGAHRLSLQGVFAFAGARDVWSTLRGHSAEFQKGDTVTLDVSQAEAIDGGTMALLVHLRGELAARGVQAEFSGSAEGTQALIHLYRGDIDATPRKKRVAESALAQIGRATVEFFQALQGILGFFGDAVVETLAVLKTPATGNWKAVLPTVERAGANAVPIVVLINFLVGFVMAFQGAMQLKQFGANIYVADLVGLSVTRELGPLMTAIILCGRSGAAFAAELGSMRVSEEIDALRTMGFSPLRQLVLPRVLALMVALPLLTLLGDLMGILGGLLVGMISLDLTFGGYLLETQKAVSMWDVFSGVIKSVVFAMAIALISCQQGFATTGGAEGVGRRTTASVVSILFALIVIDAGFTVFFHAFDL